MEGCGDVIKIMNELSDLRQEIESLEALLKQKKEKNEQLMEELLSRMKSIAENGKPKYCSCGLLRQQSNSKSTIV